MSSREPKPQQPQDEPAAEPGYNPVTTPALILGQAMVGLAQIGAELETKNEALKTTLEERDSQLEGSQAEAAEWKELAGREPLTGLHNKGSFNEAMESSLSLFMRTGTPTSLLLIDLDHFKSVNDNHGHLVGDELLKAVAAQMQRRVRKSDFLARFGGEEFAMILHDTDVEGAIKIADVIRKLISSQNSVAVKATASIGVSGFEPFLQSEDIIGQADKALYSAKQAGRNKVVAYSERLAFEKPKGQPKD